MKSLKTILKQTLTISFITLLFISCEDEKDVQSDLEVLKEERSVLEYEVEGISKIKDKKKDEIKSLNKQLKELNIYKRGDTPKYILKIKLKQSSFSLSVKKHIKDNMNSIYFEIPVDRDFYNSVSVGTKIVDEFRTGSLILYGSFGDWDMTVKDKEIR